MNGKLIVTERGRDRIHEICDQRTVIGRGADADLILRSAEASPAHCEILMTSEGFRLIDLESITGTEVNGRFVNQHLLMNGDTIKIGDAKLSFLGDSADLSQAGKAPAAPILRALPTDEEGRPKRFYRHEARKKSPMEAIKIVAILLTLVGIGVLIVSLATTKPGLAERERFAEAKRLSLSEDRSSLEQSLRLLEGIPPGVIPVAEIEDLVLETKAKLSEAKTRERDARAREFHAAFLAQLESFPEGASRTSFIRGRLEDFRREFPDHGLAREIEKKLPKGESATEVAAVPDDFWRTRRASINEAIQNEDYKAALSLIDEAKRDPIHGAMAASRLETTVEILTLSYERYFRRNFDNALEYHANGRSREALIILERLAEIPLEPYQEEAQSALARLKQD